MGGGQGGMAVGRVREMEGKGLGDAQRDVARSGCDGNDPNRTREASSDRPARI